MAKILDPDLLSQGDEVFFDATGKTIQLVTGVTLSDDGVTLQCVYSFSKEEWKNDPELIKYPFLWIAITGEQFELVNGWNFADTYSKELIRDGGWALKDTVGVSEEEYMNLTTLGSFDASLVDTAYYQQYAAQTLVTDTVYPGEVNQAIQIYSTGATVAEWYDYRDFFKIYLREQGKVYDFYDLMTEQNLTVLTYKKYALPLANSSDLKITHEDWEIASGVTYPDQPPYDGMTISWTTGITRTIGASDYDFTILIDGNDGTAEQIYEFVQWALRQDIDIDWDATGVVSGRTAEELLVFVGDTLITQYTTDGGVYIDNFQVADTNRLQFTDDLDIVRTFPFVAAGSLLFNDNLINDADATYWLFFTDANGNQYDSPDAIIINDDSDVAISGTVSAQSSISFTFDYDGNVQGGRTPETDAAYTAVSIGLSTGQYVKTTGSILRSTANVINFVAALERNYSNPA